MSFDDYTAALSASTLEQFDSVCIEFEKRWQANGSAHIEEALNGFDGVPRSALLLELLLLDIDYRFRLGQSVSPETYYSRFPDECDVIDSAFERNSGTQVKTTGAEPQSEHFSPPDTIELAQSFNIRQLHARGGIGVVYVARDEKLNRDVAVKFPRKSRINSDEQFRLHREAEITGRLDHPGIVSVHAANDAQNGMPCFVMQFVRGETLKDAIRKFHLEFRNSERNMFQSLRFRQLLKRFITVCETVSFAHERQVIHRDIKPSNIMLGHFGETYLLDWGLAKVVGEDDEIASHVAVEPENPSAPLWMTSSNTKPGQPIGTPEYASPEQITGRVAEHEVRSDVYSLGATLYCLLTGKRPIESERLNDLKTAQALHEIPDPRALVKSIPKELEAVCMKAMSFESHSRYASSKLLADDLELFLADEPVSVLNDHWSGRLRRWGRKHPRLLVGFAASLLVALASLTIGSYLLGSKNRELSLTNQDLTVAREAERLAQTATRTALKTLTDNTIERWLAQQGEVSVEDRVFLESILSQYQKFADTRLDQIDALETKVDGYLRVSQLQVLLGNRPEAIETGKTGLAFFENLEQKPSDSLLDLQSRLQSFTGINLASVGNRDEAEELIKKSLEISHQLAQRNPQSVVLQLNLAQRFDHLGNLFTQNKDYLESTEQFERAIDILSGLSATKDLMPIQLLRQRAATLHNLSLAQINLNRLKEAEANALEAIKQYQILASQTSRIADRLDHCRALSSLAVVYRKNKDHVNAKAKLNSALENLNAINVDYPALPVSYHLMGTCYYELAYIQRDQSNYSSSLELAQLSEDSIDRSLTYSPEESLYLVAQYKTALLQAFCYQRLRRLDHAAHRYEKAIEAAKRLFASDKSTYRNSLVDGLLLCADNHLRQKQFTESGQLAMRALACIEETEGSERKAFHRDEIGSHQLLGWSLMFTGNAAESAKHWQYIIRVTETQPTFLGNGESMHLTAKVYHAFCTAASEPESSFHEITELSKRQDLVPMQVFNLSCASAVASKHFEAETQRELAESKSLELLERARLAGHFSNIVQRNELEGNPSFARLKDKPEFQGILDKIDSDLNHK